MNMDNQQATAKDTELAWLAGFLDSDGSVQLTMPQSTRAKRQRCVNVWVDFSNGDALIIEKAVNIIKKLGISFHIAEKKVKPIFKEGGGKFMPRKEICLSVRVGKLSSAKFLLESLLPYIAGSKAASSRLIINYCASRIPKGRKHYDLEDMLLIKEYYEHKGGKTAARNLEYVNGVLNDYEYSSGSKPAMDGIV